MPAGRTDCASRDIAAPADRLWQAWFGPGELVQWLPPGDMRGEVLALEPSQGGAFRMRLTYASDGTGKTTANTDLVEGVFALIEPPHRFRLDTVFRSDDPAFAGIMQMTWSFEPIPGGTRVTVSAENVPPGISAADHANGLDLSLDNLARHVET